jgi:flagellar hook-associated protein 2
MKEGEFKLNINMNYNLFSSKMRLGGLATGFDTDSMVSNLMRIERMPLDRLFQSKQLAQWKKDEYREITNLLRSVKEEYFNVLKPKNYMLSQATYNKMNTISSNSSVVTAEAGLNAIAGEHEVIVTSLAKAAKIKSQGNVTSPITSKSSIEVSDIENISKKNITITLDGISKNIAMGSYGNSCSVEDLAIDLQEKIDTAFGAGKVNIKVEKIETDKWISLSTKGGASKITMTSGSLDDGLKYLHIESGSSNRLDTKQTLEDLSFHLAKNLVFDDNGNLEFSINGKEFIISKDTTLEEMINTINRGDEARVSMMYDEVSDKFQIIAKQTGAGETIEIAEKSGNFFNEMLGINQGFNNVEKGKDATVIIDGESITRSSNNFIVNGVAYSLHKTSTEAQNISVNHDVDGIYDTIVSFVDTYNNLIEKINDKLSQEYDRDFQPLTQQQRDIMSEKDIEKFETQAKTGLLRNDSILEKIVLNLRKALFDKVDDSNINLTNLGITTGAYYEKGKLKINETELKKAIADNPEGITELFIKKSEEYSGHNRTLDEKQRAARYEESGLAQRIFDIIEDNISSIRDSRGEKGILLEKAGIQGDASEFSNLIYNEIRTYDSKIDALYAKLIEKENYYYKKLATMEQIIGNMNAQSNWLTAQISQFNS